MMIIIIYVYKNNAIYVEDKYSINVHRNMSYIRIHIHYEKCWNGKGNH